MKQVNITRQVLEEYPSEQYEAILEDTYRNYDSRLITDDLQLNVNELRDTLRRGQTYEVVMFLMTTMKAASQHSG